MGTVSADQLIIRFGGANVEEAIKRAEAMGHRIIKNSPTEARLGRAASATGRNKPCPCGSGVKFKKCCLPRIQKERHG
jgi:uncharacterized protein YecA (UPF0149 family)